MSQAPTLTILISIIFINSCSSTYFRAYQYSLPPSASNYGSNYHSHYPASPSASNYYDPFSPYQYSQSSLKQASSYQQPSYWTYQPTTGLVPGQTPTYGQTPTHGQTPTYGQTPNYGNYPGYSSTSGFTQRAGMYQPAYTSTSLTSSYGTPTYGGYQTPTSGYGYSYGTPTSYPQAVYGHNYYQTPTSSSGYGMPSSYGSYGSPTSYGSSITYGRGSHYPSASGYDYQRQPRWPSMYQQPYNPYQTPTGVYGNAGPGMPASPWMDPRMMAPGMYPRNPMMAPAVREARAVMKGNPGHQIDGTVDFIQMPYQGVRVKGRLYGIPGGQSSKGLHILNSKSCPEILPDTQNIDHFNPLKSPTHGPRDGAFKHVGDLGNIFVQFDGVSIFEFTSNELTLDGEHSIVNRSIIITDRFDDFGTNYNLESRKTGNSGKAIGCGLIIMKKESSYYNNKA